jgi:hypothetical protein
LGGTRGLGLGRPQHHCRRHVSSHTPRDAARACRCGHASRRLPPWPPHRAQPCFLHLGVAPDGRGGSRRQKMNATGAHRTRPARHTARGTPPASVSHLRQRGAPSRGVRPPPDPVVRAPLRQSGSPGAAAAERHINAAVRGRRALAVLRIPLRGRRLPQALHLGGFQPIRARWAAPPCERSPPQCRRRGVQSPPKHRNAAGSRCRGAQCRARVE